MSTVLPPALLLLLLLLQLPDPVNARFGQLRHVQLLEPRGTIVRFATQVDLGTLRGEGSSTLPSREESAIALFEDDAIVAELCVGQPLGRDFTWVRRPAWSLLELERAQRLLVLDPQHFTPGGSPAGGGLRVLSFPDGEEQRRLADVQEIEDTVVHRERADAVVRSGDVLRWLRFSAVGELVRDQLVDPELDSVACAALPRGASVGWCVGWREGDLHAVPFDADGVEPDRTFPVTFSGGPGDEAPRPAARMRAAAWGDEFGAYLAVGWPGYRAGVGKLQVIDVSDQPRVLWEGRPDREVGHGGSLDQRDYSQALAFVPDADGDCVPEVLVTGPWCALPRVDLISGKAGTLLSSWTPPGGFTSTGHSLSLSADRTHALVGGAEQRAYPENLAHEGQAHLLDVRRMKTIRTWKRSSRPR